MEGGYVCMYVLIYVCTYVLTYVYTYIRYVLLFFWAYMKKDGPTVTHEGFYTPYNRFPMSGLHTI
jgi:hypothetical protein